MTNTTDFSRRKILGMGLACAGAAILPNAGLSAVSKGAYGLNMINGNTGEKFRHVILEDGTWIREALAEFDWFARDWRENAEYPIDPDNMLSLVRLHKMMDTTQPMVLLSGYRTPKTNKNLRGAATHSLHMRGLALDITQPGRPTSSLLRAARSLKVGGVGYYPSQNFVHIDTGSIRYWKG